MSDPVTKVQGGEVYYHNPCTGECLSCSAITDQFGLCSNTDCQRQLPKNKFAARSQRFVEKASDHELLWAWVHYDGVNFIINEQDVDEHDAHLELLERGYNIIIG